MTKPSSNNPRPFRRGPTPSGKRRFLLVGAVMIVLGIFAVQSLWPSMSNDATTQQVDPDTLVDDAIAGMAFEHTTDAATAIAEAEAALNASDAAARARVQATLDEAQAAISAIDATAAGLTPAPASYVVGQDVSRYTEDVLVQVQAFEVPTLPGSMEDLEASGIAWEEIERLRRSGNSSLPETGVEELDAYRSTLQDYVTMILDTAEAQDDGTTELLWLSLASLGVPVGERPGAGGLDGKAFPDDEAAKEAMQHATFVMDVADRNLNAFDAELDKVILVHQDLLVTVDFVLATAPAIQNKTLLEYEESLQQRIGQLEDLRTQAHAQVTERADGAIVLLEKTEINATASVHVAVDEEVRRIQGTAMAQADRLDALADQVAADAAEGITAIEDGTDETLRVLAEIEEETGRDMAPMAHIVSEASKTTIEDIRSEAAVQEKLLRDASVRIVGQANGRANALYELASGTTADLREEAAMQIEGIERARAFADARVDHVQDLRRQAHEEAYQLAVDTLNEQVAAHMDRTLDIAWDINQQSQLALDGTYEVVQDIRMDSSVVVPEDVDYIWEVVQDYRSVPTPEREEAASIWEQVALGLTSDLDGIVGPQGQVSRVEAKVLETVHEGGLLDQVEQGLLLRGAGA